MMTQEITVENIKCSGCLNSIKTALLKIANLQEVSIDKEPEIISINSNLPIDRNEIVNQLAKMGYPEKGNNNLLLKAKFFLSCTIGNLSEKVTQFKMSKLKSKIVLMLFITTFTNVNAQITKAELIANGLTCSMCSNATFNQLKTIPFLDSIDTDVEHTKFILYFKQNADFDLKLIKSKVEDAGFSVGSLLIFMPFNKIEVYDDFQYSVGDITYHFMDTEKQVLNGIAKMKVVDKGFISDKEYKKYLKLSSKYPCYNAGKIDNVKMHYHLKVI